MDLKLYMFDTCPYCRRVLAEIDSQGRTDIELRNIRKNEDDYETLVNVTGKSQVPCLFIDGEPLFESADIIEWLKENPQT